MATIATAVRLNDMMSAPLKNITSAMNMMLSSWDSLENATSSGLDVGDVENIRSELNQATQALDRMGDEQEEFNRKVNDGSDALSGMTGKIVGMLGAFVSLGAIKNTLASAIEFASDLTEVQNVVDVSFGNSAEAVNKWAQTTLNAYGLNELSAKQFAGTMGAMLKSSGLTGDAVTEMSMKIAELSGDMASFYNLEGDEAFSKLRSGISGETEPLKQLGINMSVANLEAFALSQGIKKTYDKMSQGEQVMLRYNYLLQATADAQGDFARTSDSFANQQKLLGENWKAFTGEIVSGLLPALSSLFTMLNSGITWLAQNWSILQPIILGVVAALGVYFLATSGVTLATKAWAAAQSFFNKVMAANPVVLIIMAIILLISLIYAVISAINKVQGTTISATGVIVGIITTMVSYLWNILATFANFFINVWTDPIGSVARLFQQLADNVLGVLEVIAKGIDAVFGSNLQESVKGWRSGLSSLVEDKFGTGVVDLRWDSVDAFDWGYNLGEGVEEKVGNIFGGVGNISGMEQDVEGINTNTGAISDSLDITNENLKYLRDAAEQEVVNRFTTAEVRVELGGVTNNVNQNTDLDGVMDYFVSATQEALERVAEGVHD